jgi:hypothetical protein
MRYMLSFIKMNVPNRQIIYVALFVFGMGVTYYMATTVVPNVLVTMTKAAPASAVSIKDSYLIGAKILAKADGEDICKVNVFVLDKDQKGVGGKTVTLNGDPEKGTRTVQSDADGKASFDILSTKEGQFEITGSIEGQPLTKTLKITFRN